MGVESEGGRGGGVTRPPPPNFTHCLHNELHYSTVVDIAFHYFVSTNS